MPDPNKGKYNKIYKTEFTQAQEALGAFIKAYEGELTWSQHDYQAFQYKDDEVCLIFYPHKTSAFNKHIRVRSQNSKDKARADEMMKLLNGFSGYNCTFSKKTRINMRAA